MPDRSDEKETEIVKRILRYLEKTPDILAWRTNTGVMSIKDRFIRFGKAGQSDIFAILKHENRGLALFIEVKTRTGKQSEKQKDFQASVESFGACYILARSVEDVIEQLVKFKSSLKNAVVDPVKKFLEQK